MENEIFLMDIDGVVCDHAKSICEWVNNNYGLRSSPDDVIDWDYNFGPITFVEAVRKCYCKPEFIMNMTEYPGIKELIDFINQGMNLKFATSRSTCEEATRNWIFTKFGNYDIIFHKNKVQLKFNYLVDDYAPTILDITIDDNKIGFLMKRPWNNDPVTKCHISKMANLYMVESFLEVEKILINIRDSKLRY